MSPGPRAVASSASRTSRMTSRPDPWRRAVDVLLAQSIARVASAHPSAPLPQGKRRASSSADDDIIDRLRASAQLCKQLSAAHVARVIGTTERRVVQAPTAAARLLLFHFVCWSAGYIRSSLADSLRACLALPTIGLLFFPFPPPSGRRFLPSPLLAEQVGSSLLVVTHRRRQDQNLHPSLQGRSRALVLKPNIVTILRYNTLLSLDQGVARARSARRGGICLCTICAYCRRVPDANGIVLTRGDDARPIRGIRRGSHFIRMAI